MMSIISLLRISLIHIILVFATLIPLPVSAQSAAAEGWTQRGIEAYNRRDLKEAWQSFSRAIKADPKYAIAYYNRCIVNSELGDVQKALVDCEQAFGIEPNYADAYYLHGLLLSQHLGESKKAMQDFNQAIRINPKFTAAYLKRGNARARQGDLEGGVKDYSQAIQMEPDYADDPGIRKVACAIPSYARCTRTSRYFPKS